MNLMHLLETHPLYVVLVIALIVWLGIALYIMRVDTRLRNIENNGN